MAAGGRAGEGSPAVNDQTVFEIGSVSKVFTTTLLAEMVIAGEVALDDPISEFLPDSVRAPSRNGRQITLLDLATSSSGLPRLPDDFTPADPTNPYADYEVRHLYAFLSGYMLTRDPGASYEYSNLGMGLLGHLLALRAGMSYEDLVIRRILTPLGMRDTRITLTPAMSGRLATGHGADLEVVGNWDIAVLAGAGGWRSTTTDMLRFLAAAVTPPPGSLGRALRMAMEPRRPAGSPVLRIGLGWQVLERNGQRIVWHNGETGGYHSFLGLDPASGANVVVLANSATDIDDIGLHILDSSIAVRHPPPPRPAVTVDATVLERYVGRYDLAPEFAIDVTREGNALFVQATGQPRFRVFAASPTMFFLRVVDAEVGFTVDASGTVTGLVLHQGGQATPGRRLGAQ
jgi:CubicO group peptidase (beta-lactamase class C family)